METSIIQSLIKSIQELKADVASLQSRRLTQDMIIPDAIKTRHLGEPNRFIRGGIAGNKPSQGESTQGGMAQYFDTSANKIWVYNPASGTWVSVTLS